MGGHGYDDAGGSECGYVVEIDLGRIERCDLKSQVDDSGLQMEGGIELNINRMLCELEIDGRQNVHQRFRANWHSKSVGLRTFVDLYHNRLLVEQTPLDIRRRI